MKRVGATALAVLMVVSAFGMAGCKGRKSRGGRSTSHAGAQATDRNNNPSPTRSPTQAAGRSCAEILTQVVTDTKVQWKLDSAATQATADSQNKPGSRSCQFVVAGTSAFPQAKMTVQLYRPRPGTDTPEKMRETAAKQAENCAEKVSGPSGATLAVQCLKKASGTAFDVRTTYSGANGYVLVLVSAQPTTAASTAVQTKVRDVSRAGAGVAFDMI
ncbi:hypothetical protein Val02_88660 [Virgisporangium aliadipatigenens]|uniref:DUF3558 domain-containing protein n=1 Tax=Virgisporangium aliadipatigenens TaxID=741659 RepID=A0A8J3YYE5_9ACTN|nr:hypothetical protein [Virgisporangium aliadipatigenens]GIJ51980.1 hypothetical protein Val02_88660 [Virgisporangium aliadipatigenens]